MRRALVVVHRWAGLTIALVLVVAGITGAVLPYDEVLNHMLARQTWRATPPAPGARPLSGIELMRRVESQTGAVVRYMPLQLDPDFAAGVFVRPMRGRPSIDFDEVIADPYTGAVRRKVLYGRLSDGSVNVIPFLLQLHYSLAAGPLGSSIFGLAALIWVLVCIVGFYLTLPARRYWKAWLRLWRPAWSVRTHAGLRTLLYDTHRAGGLWIWPILLVFAWSAVAFNLPQVHDPVNRLFGGLGLYEPPANPHPGEGIPMSLESAVARGETLMLQQSRKLAFTIERGYALTLDPRAHAIGYYARTSLDRPVEHQGSTLVWFDAIDGHFLGFQPPFGSTPADRADKWIRELHVAGVFGPLYRIFVSLIGLMTAAVSLTGVILWARRQTLTRGVGAQSPGADDWGLDPLARK